MRQQGKDKKDLMIAGLVGLLLLMFLYILVKLNKPTPSACRGTINANSIKRHPVQKPKPVAGNTDFSHGEHVVMFYAPWCGWSKKTIPEWDKFAEQHDDEHTGVRVSKVDCTKHKDVCQRYQINGYPSILRIKHGKKSGKFSMSRTVDNFNKFVNNETIDADPEPKPPSDKNTKTRVVMFYAPWCGWSKRTMPIWDEFTSKHNNPDVLVEKVDCTVNKSECEKHNVRGYPSILKIQKGHENIEFEDERTVESLMNFASV